LNEIEKITSRETVILELLKKGFSNEKISQETEVSVNTIKFHLKRIYKKLNAGNRVEAINKFNEIKNQKS
jgi:DNA-binding NarL/FixJ family response regulator